MSKHSWIDVAVQTPAHSQVGGLLSYRCPFDVQPGQLVRVPLGKRDVLGVVWAVRDAAPEGMPESVVRDVLGVLEGLPPLGQIGKPAQLKSRPVQLAVETNRAQGSLFVSQRNPLLSMGLHAAGQGAQQRSTLTACAAGPGLKSLGRRLHSSVDVGSAGARVVCQ